MITKRGPADPALDKITLSCRIGAQDEQHPWRYERVQIVQFGASGTSHGGVASIRIWIQDPVR